MPEHALVSHFRHARKHAERHRKAAVKSFHSTHKHARKLLKRHDVVIGKLRDHSVRSAALAGASVGLLTVPVIATASPHAGASAAGPAPTPLAHTLIQDHQQKLNISPVESTSEAFGPSASLASIAGIVPQKIKEIAPQLTSNMSKEQEAQFELLIKQVYGVEAKAELDGIRLNVTQGIMAGEQHLPLYPGDTLDSHTSDPTRNLTGMVPGLPSWGYFAENRQSVTKFDIETERYYFAVQTFLSPGWDQNVQKMYSWYKYRTMIAINPMTGEAVVGRVGDAGPGPSTGRSFGGSNEVLMGLGLGKIRTGHIYMFFVDDPTGSIPLGPIGGAK